MCASLFISTKRRRFFIRPPLITPRVRSRSIWREFSCSCDSRNDVGDANRPDNNAVKSISIRLQCERAERGMGRRERLAEFNWSAARVGRSDALNYLPHRGVASGRTQPLQPPRRNRSSNQTGKTMPNVLLFDPRRVFRAARARAAARLGMGGHAARVVRRRTSAAPPAGAMHAARAVLLPANNYTSVGSHRARIRGPIVCRPTSLSPSDAMRARPAARKSN